jgi:hypothetical protein
VAISALLFDLPRTIVRTSPGTGAVQGNEPGEYNGNPPIRRLFKIMWSSLATFGGGEVMKRSLAYAVSGLLTAAMPIYAQTGGMGSTQRRNDRGKQRWVRG